MANRGSNLNLRKVREKVEELEAINKEVNQLFPPNQISQLGKIVTRSSYPTIAYLLFGISLGGPAYSINWTSNFVTPGEPKPELADNLEILIAGSPAKPHYYIAIKSLIKQVSISLPKAIATPPANSVYPGAFELLKEFCKEYSIPFNGWCFTTNTPLMGTGTTPDWFLALSSCNQDLFPEDISWKSISLNSRELSRTPPKPNVEVTIDEPE